MKKIVLTPSPALWNNDKLKSNYSIFGYETRMNGRYLIFRGHAFGTKREAKSYHITLYFDNEKESIWEFDSISQAAAWQDGENVEPTYPAGSAAKEIHIDSIDFSENCYIGAIFEGKKCVMLYDYKHYQFFCLDTGCALWSDENSTVHRYIFRFIKEQKVDVFLFESMEEYFKWISAPISLPLH